VLFYNQLFIQNNFNVMFIHQCAHDMLRHALWMAIKEAMVTMNDCDVLLLVFGQNLARHFHARCSAPHDDNVLRWGGW
jgi:hypothetical protein